MRFGEFLFGKKKNSGSSISDRVAYGAKSHLDRKIIKSFINKWWVVLIRKWIIYPLAKIPFLPVVEALEIRQDFLSFDLARDVLTEAGLRVSTSYFKPFKDLKAGNISSTKAFSSFMRSVFWKPSPRKTASRQIRFVIGETISWEKKLCTKLFMLTVFSWLIFAGFHSLALLDLFKEGLEPISKDLTRLYSKHDLWATVYYGKSIALHHWLMSVGAWSVALIFSFLLSNRPWIKTTQQVKEFILNSGQFKAEEILQKTNILAMNDMVFMSTPSMNIAKIRSLRSGWPAGFLPGEIIEHTNKPEDALVLKRPEKAPAIFGGDNAMKDILSNLKAYDSGIMSVVKNAIKAPSDEELIFMGESIDPRWWKSTQIYLKLGNSPHFFILGQTGSGKTKTVLSLIYSIARSSPDTQWLFADGKSSVDYDAFADAYSIFPVAKAENMSGDPLIEFANIIEYVWGEFSRRKNLFERARLDGKPCPSIYQYRELVGPLPQIFLVVDEFGVFITEMGFETNWKTVGTIASRLKRLAAEARSVGIHLIFATQRFQQDNMPTVLRSNLTTHLVHNVQLTDANFMEIPDATNLDTGQFYLTAPGLFCRNTGISKVKVKMPYIGDNPSELLKQTVKPISMDLKREFDPHLIFNRGSDDLEKMSISELCIRLQRFFKDQDYHTKEMVSDLEATELQLEIVKSKRIYEKMADGSTVTRLEPLENSKPIGISLLRSDEIDEETFYGIQGKYAKYSAIMVFIVGKAIQASKYKFVQGALNESTTKFYVVPFREYYKDMRFVEMNRKQGTEVDVILPKLMRLGLSHGNSGDEKKKIDLKDLSSTRIPMTTRISAILHAVQLHKGIESGETRGVPYIKTILPGSTELYFLVSADKNGRDDVKEVALNLANEKKTVIIVSDLKFIQSDVKLMNSKGIQIWRSTHVNDTRVKVADRTFAKRFVGNLMVELGLSGPDIIGVKIGPNAKITLSSRFNEDVTKMIGCSLVCGITGFSFVNYKPMEIDAYRIDKMSIPESAIITVLAGAAPQGAKASNVTTGEDWTAPVFPPNSKLEVQSGIIVRKKSKISESDSLLAEMKKDL